jgi:hypothetical protein
MSPGYELPGSNPTPAVSEAEFRSSRGITRGRSYGTELLVLVAFILSA